MTRKALIFAVILTVTFNSLAISLGAERLSREEKRKQEIDELQKRFKWWPTDANPGPVKDPDRGGYW